MISGNGGTSIDLEKILVVTCCLTMSGTRFELSAECVETIARGFEWSTMVGLKKGPQHPEPALRRVGLQGRADSWCSLDL